MGPAVACGGQLEEVWSDPTQQWVLVSRRLAAIPLRLDSRLDPVPVQPGEVEGPAHHLPLVGAVTSAVCFLGCALKECHRRLKGESAEIPSGSYPTLGGTP